MTDTSAEAAKKRAEEQLSTALAGMVSAGNAEVADEADTEAEAKRQEKRSQEQAAAKVSPDHKISCSHRGCGTCVCHIRSISGVLGFELVLRAVCTFSAFATIAQTYRLTRHNTGKFKVVEGFAAGVTRGSAICMNRVKCNCALGGMAGAL